MSEPSWGRALRSLDNSFVHGVAAYAAQVYAPIIFGEPGWIMAGLICVYAGWVRQAYLAAFLGGVIAAAVALTAVGALSLPGSGFGVFFMVPFALLVILPTALAGYLVGSVISAIARRQPKAR